MCYMFIFVTIRAKGTEERQRWVQVQVSTNFIEQKGQQAKIKTERDTTDSTTAGVLENKETET